MLKCLSGTIISTVLLVSSFSVSAEDAFRFDTGADFWWSSNRINDDRRDTDNTGFFHIAVEHDEQYIPNAKFRFSIIDADSIDLDKYDYTFYYDVIEHEKLDFDLGVTLTQYKKTQYIDDAKDKYGFNGWTWSFYANGAIQIPKTAMQIIGQYDFSDRNGKKTADFLAGFEYAADIPNADAYARFGYRVMDYTFSELGTAEPVEILIDGWFVGFGLYF